MNNPKYNSEGYADPTAYYGTKEIIREESETENLHYWSGMATRKLWPVRNAKNTGYFPRRTKYSNVAAAGSVRIKILKVLHI